MSFNLKDLAQTIAKIGLPILGTALGGPAGGMIASKLAESIGAGDASPDTLMQLLTTNADALAKAKEFEIREKQMLLEHALAMEQEETKRLEAVNATLQADSKGTSWLQQNHHALESLATVALVFAVYVFLPVFKLPVPVVPETAWITLAAILGVTAWHKGAAEVQQAKNDG